MRVLIAVMLTLVLTTPAQAMSLADIETAASTAHGGLRSVVKALARKSVAGRDNGTPGSLTAQTSLIKQLRPLAVGLNGGGTDDAAYKQPFTYLGQTGTN